MGRVFIFGLLLSGILLFAGCGVYSFTGASIDGKTIRIQTMENRAQNVVPTLSANLTDQIRSRILSQTGLAPVNTENADYDISGVITGYQFTVTGVSERSEEHTSELQSREKLVCRLLLEKKNNKTQEQTTETN